MRLALIHTQSLSILFLFSVPRIPRLPSHFWFRQVLIKQEIQRKSGYAIQVDEEHLRVQLDTIQSELNAPTQFKVSVSTELQCFSIQ